ASTGFRVALAGLAATLIAAVLFWPSLWQRPVKPLGPTITAEQSPNPSEAPVTARQPAAGRPESPPESTVKPPRIAAFVLMPSTRGGNTALLSIPGGVDRIRLDLRLDSLDYRRYEAI